MAELAETVTPGLILLSIPTEERGTPLYGLHQVLVQELQVVVAALLVPYGWMHLQLLREH